MNNNTKKITTTAMFAVIAYVVVVAGRILVVLFLKYDPKDIIIATGGLITEFTWKAGKSEVICRWRYWTIGVKI